MSQSSAQFLRSCLANGTVRLTEKKLCSDNTVVELNQCVLNKPARLCSVVRWKRSAMRRSTVVVFLMAGVLILAVSAVYLSYSAEISRMRARTESGGRIADTSIGRMEYAERGAGVALLSIHGAGGG